MEKYELLLNGKNKNMRRNFSNRTNLKGNGVMNNVNNLWCGKCNTQ